MVFYFYITLWLAYNFFGWMAVVFFLGMHSYVPATSCLALLRIIWPSNGIESVRYCVSVTGIGKWQARQWKNQNAYRED